MKKIILMLFLFGMVANVYGANIDIESSRSFTINETIKFNYTVSGEDQVRFIPSISCENTPEPPLQIISANLSEGDYKGVYSHIRVSRNTQPQSCDAALRLLDTNQSESKTIEIMGRPKLNVSINLCSTEACQKTRTVFAGGEAPYITAESAEDLELSTLLVSPDGSTDKLELPANLEGLEAGNYRLKVNANKQGYQKLRIERRFAVIAESPDFEDENFSEKSPDKKPGFLMTIWDVITELF